MNDPTPDSDVVWIDLDELINNWQPGSYDPPWTWQNEHDDLWTREPDRMRELETQILNDGIQQPILLGTDQRVWDGHHRICIAIRHTITPLPATRDCRALR